MSRVNRALAPIVLTLIVSSCSSLWNRANVNTIKGDIEALLDRNGVQVDLQNCTMVGSTRTGMCRFRHDVGAADAIIQALHLDPVLFENATVAFIDAELEAGCGSYPNILEGSGGMLYLISGRPQSLRLSNGTAFEYLLLLYNPSSGEACLQVSYAYG
jgi:hypothetical protein